VPDDLWWFCFLRRVRAFLHVRYPFALVSPLFNASGWRGQSSMLLPK
jgi:hypothetical protein